MYYSKRKGIDESKMTFSYLDIIRLRLYYEWQSESTGYIEKKKKTKLVNIDDLLANDQ